MNRPRPNTRFCVMLAPSHGIRFARFQPSITVKSNVKSSQRQADKCTVLPNYETVIEPLINVPCLQSCVDDRTKASEVHVADSRLPPPPQL